MGDLSTSFGAEGKEDARSRSRGSNSPGLCLLTVPLSDKGAGKAGRRLRPQRRVLKVEKSAHGFDRYSRDNPGFPRAMVLRLIRALPGEAAFLAR
jgi:hypothetical protein